MYLIYGAFPLLDPFNAESLKTQLNISGVYLTPVSGRLLIGGFPYQTFLMGVFNL